MVDSKSIYIERGSSVGVLLLHGFSSGPSQFKELSEYLANNNFTVYAPTIAGHATKPEDLLKSSPDDWKLSVLDAYKKLKEKVSNVFIIGNSFGSNLSFWLAKETDNDPLGIIALGAPIFFRYQRIIKFRLATYGRLRKYYRKPKRLYKADYTDMSDKQSYDIVPVKSLNDVLYFIENETICNIGKVKCPILLANASVDPVVHPKSAKFIYDNIGSPKKETYVFESNRHGVAAENPCPGLFCKIVDFIMEIISKQN